MSDIVISRLCKSFGGREILRDFSAVFPDGKITALMAPSGAGKTTLLRIIDGSERADSGTIEGLSGRKLGAVFQEDRLLGRLDAADNLRFVTPSLTDEKISSALLSVGLIPEEIKGRAVCDFSGGMRRRVAILRALLSDADTLLLDEPFKGLDEASKKCVADYTVTHCKKRTVIFVTHSRGEALAVADSILELPMLP